MEIISYMPTGYSPFSAYHQCILFLDYFSNGSAQCILCINWNVLNSMVDLHHLCLQQHATSIGSF